MTVLIVAAAFLLIAVAEHWRPLRQARESKLRRMTRNFSLAGMTAVAMLALQTPLLYPLARHVEENRLGLLYWWNVPDLPRRIAGVLLLDYSLWWWHWINHEVPFFWRFHKVHHVDHDLDASTAFRFHFGEMSLSVFFRMGQLALFGIDLVTMSTWQLLLMISILFHHSNLRIPWRVERWLVRLVVTPRMHGIHHSDYREETSSNWSSLLSWWDFLHRTFRMDVPQGAIRIGVAAYQRPQDVTLGKVVALPFVPPRPDWIDEAGTPRISRFAKSEIGNRKS